MDIGTVRGLVTLAFLLAFVGLVAWAWSSRRKADFDEAARLPLGEDPRQNKGDTSDE
jgi:cytochrome c oxidase cbb3-type subunit 4